MTYRIGQDSQYIGRNYWKWRAWIDADDPDLDRVDRVVWLLHPTFPNPQVERINRDEKFMLETAGWGTFELRAQLRFKDGKSENLEHYLELEGPSARARSAGEADKPLQVFLSYGSEDSRRAEDLKRALQEHDVNVADARSIKPGEPWKIAVERMIRQSDAVIGLFGSESVSPFLISELKEASRVGKQVLAVRPSGTGKAFGLPEGVVQFTVDFDRSNEEAALQSLLDQLKQGQGS